MKSIMKSPADDAQYDDERLIRQIVQSREDALARLYDRYNRLVFSIALAIIGDSLTAEEITLDVFARVWQNAASYRADRARVRTWLTHIARHHAIDVLRRRSKRLDFYTTSWDEVSLGTAFPTEDLQELVELSLLREKVHAALARLPHEQKQALALAYYGGFTQVQIAEMLNQPLGTIKTRLRLGLQKLYSCLQDEQEDKPQLEDSAVDLPFSHVDKSVILWHA